MITFRELEPIEVANPSGRWWIYNGFLSWAYGSPQNPTPVTRACALRILQATIKFRYPDALEKLSRLPAALDYADEGKELFHQTGGHRLIGFLEEGDCIFSRKRRPAEFDYLA